VPLSLTRSEQFEELVAASLGRLRVRWAQALESIDVEVEDVPDPDAGAGSARLGRAEEAVGGRPARIVVYRRAVEARARGQRSREALVHEVVVAALADLLGLDPATVDPDSED
jgi:predicted Zn-dependent protease with MMP-like domain